ncbi:uncharacterized protein LOC111621656 [Centruroides sculpturatus]|uniref:uncharacterized protein LOC111621656 n=1 Tax=Centruroides sculpturatus TaxID=218467 RepID=UPI000C6E7432|nr:uncharacterized protein LOC111621656 [Centruroides sculpturatus]
MESHGVSRMYCIRPARVKTEDAEKKRTSSVSDTASERLLIQGNGEKLWIGATVNFTKNGHLSDRARTPNKRQENRLDDRGPWSGEVRLSSLERSFFGRVDEERSE